MTIEERLASLSLETQDVIDYMRCTMQQEQTGSCSLINGNLEVTWKWINDELIETWKIEKQIKVWRLKQKQEDE